MRRLGRSVFLMCAIGGAHGLVLRAQAPSAPAPMSAQHERDQFRVEGPPLTLAEAVDEATQHNPDLVALRGHATAVEQAPAVARALPPPMIETTAWQWPINSLNPANTNMYMFLATQDLPGRGKREARAMVAQKDVALAAIDVTTRERDIVSQVKDAYADLVVSRTAIAIHLDTADLLREVADVAVAKYETTTGSQRDALKPSVELSRLHADLIRLDQDRHLATARLNALMGRPLDTPIGPLADPVERTLSATLSDVTAWASANQPALQSAQLSVERAQADLAVARHEHAPDFSVQAGYMLLPHQTDGVLARVAITWPNAPWSRRAIDAREREAGADVQAATAATAAAQNTTRLAVQDAYVRVKSAEAEAALLRTTVLPQTRQALAASRAAYEAGRATLLDVLDDERGLLDTEMDYYRALGDFDHAAADLEHAIGASIAPEYLPITAGGSPS